MNVSVHIHKHIDVLAITYIYMCMYVWIDLCKYMNNIKKIDIHTLVMVTVSKEHECGA